MRSPSRAERSASGAEAWLRGPAIGGAERTATSSSPSTPTTTSATAPAGTSHHVPSASAGRTRHGGDRLTGDEVGVVEHGEGGEVVDERHRGDGPAERPRPRRRGRPAPRRRHRRPPGEPMPGAPSSTSLSHSSRSKPSGSAARATAVGLSLAKKPSNSSAMASWSARQSQVDGHRCALIVLVLRSLRRHGPGSAIVAVAAQRRANQATTRVTPLVARWASIGARTLPDRRRSHEKTIPATNVTTTAADHDRRRCRRRSSRRRRAGRSRRRCRGSGRCARARTRPSWPARPCRGPTTRSRHRAARPGR